jgi:hypothetical protein
MTDRGHDDRNEGDRHRRSGQDMEASGPQKHQNITRDSNNGWDLREPQCSLLHKIADHNPPRSSRRRDAAFTKLNSTPSVSRLARPARRPLIPGTLAKGIRYCNNKPDLSHKH